MCIFNKVISLGIGLTLLLSFNVQADQTPQPAIIVIGASLSSGDLPLNDQGVGVTGGVSVGLGSYLSLGHALTRDPRLPGYIINEAQAGATTFTRGWCPPGGPCVPDLWRGYNEQLDRALARVGVPGLPVYNAKFVVITLSNDCFHSNAFGIPQEDTVPCGYAEYNESIDRLIALGQRVLDLGMVPIFDNVLPATTIDLTPRPPHQWVQNPTDYTEMHNLRVQRLKAELPDAVVLDIWDESYEHIDGIHPTNKSARKAASIIAQYILDNS